MSHDLYQKQAPIWTRIAMLCFFLEYIFDFEENSHESSNFLLPGVNDNLKKMVAFDNNLFRTFVWGLV